jgi:predicted ATP-grasp superfamily ATP-dependent carboligase
MSLFSRYASEKFVYTSPKKDAKRFIQDINRYCREFAADCIFPTSESAIMTCSENRKELISVPIIPRERDIQTMFSKANTLQVAHSVGILAPKTIHISDEMSRAFSESSVKFPAVVKSEKSEVMQSTKTKTSAPTAYVFNRRELQDECQKRLASGESVLVQEFIDGHGLGICGLFDEGRPVALIGHRRIRESNPQGGPSAVAETVEIEPGVMHSTVELLKRIGYTGPAMVEYKIERHTGKPYLMEINGRFWGAVLLASAAGLDLPYLYWKMLNGMDVHPEETKYQTGIKGRYLVGDTKALIHCMKGRPKYWPGEFPRRWPAIKAYVNSFFDAQTRDLILTHDDPYPFLGRLMQEFV